MTFLNENQINGTDLLFQSNLDGLDSNLSIRDYIAIMAMRGICAESTEEDTLRDIADKAFNLADEMIKRSGE
jgi:hypothetical protein